MSVSGFSKSQFLLEQLAASASERGSESKQKIGQPPAIEPKQKHDGLSYRKYLQ
jgi:hypothetical protein